MSSSQYANRLIPPGRGKHYFLAGGCLLGKILEAGRLAHATLEPPSIRPPTATKEKAAQKAAISRSSAVTGYATAPSTCCPSSSRGLRARASYSAPSDPSASRQDGRPRRPSADNHTPRACASRRDPRRRYPPMRLVPKTQARQHQASPAREV